MSPWQHKPHTLPRAHAHCTIHCMCYAYTSTWQHGPIPPPLKGRPHHTIPPKYLEPCGDCLGHITRCVVVYRHMRRKSYRQRACHHEQCSPRAALFCLQLRFGEPYPTRQLRFKVSFSLQSIVLCLIHVQFRRGIPRTLSSLRPRP